MATNNSINVNDVTPLSVVKGGTGLTAITANQILYSSSSNVIAGLITANNGVLITNNTGVPSLLANSATAGYVLTANAGAPPSWQASGGGGGGSHIHTINADSGSITGNTVSIGGGTTGLTTSGVATAMVLTGTLALSNGGTNASLTASNGGIFYSTGSAGAILSGTATAGQILRSGTSAAPSWSTTTYPATNAVNTLLYASSANVMAALATANSAMLVTNSSGVPAWSGTMTDGQVIIGTTSGTPVAATLSAGTNVSITNAAGSITINASGGLTWTTTASTSVSAAVNNAYIANVATLCTVTLPAICAIGQVVAVEGLGAGGWRLAANTGQTIKIGSSTTSSAGSLSSTAISDNVYAVCIVANTTWRVQTTNSAGLDIL